MVLLVVLPVARTAKRTKPRTPSRAPSAAEPHAARTESWWDSHRLAAAAVITAITALAYAPSLRGGFILDDYLLLVYNPAIKAADGLGRIWNIIAAHDPWPLTTTSFWFEWRLWKDAPTGYHVTNLLLHIGDALLIAAILRRLSLPGAWLAALLFAVHPVNVESVAWITQRKNLLAMSFFLLANLVKSIRMTRGFPLTSQVPKTQ